MKKQSNNGPVYSGHPVLSPILRSPDKFPKINRPIFSAKLTCILAVTLYIIFTLPFPKGDRYIQVSLHFHISDFALGLALKQRLDATRK